MITVVDGVGVGSCEMASVASEGVVAVTTVSDFISVVICNCSTTGLPASEAEEIVREFKLSPE